MSEDAKTAIGFAFIIIIAIVSIFGGLSWAMSDHVYSASEAGAQCAGANKRLGEYTYSYGRSTFTCVDAPL